MNRARELLSPEATTIVTGRETRSLRMIVALVAVLVTVAAVKPWGAGTAAIRTNVSPPGIGRGEHAAAEPSETLAASPPTRASDVAESICGQPLGWRVVTSGLWQGRPSRASIALTPVAATRPTDGRIPFVVADGDRIDDLGWCSPSSDAAGSGRTVTVAAWRLDATSPRALALQPIGAPSASRAGLYTSSADRPNTPWLPGRYVFRVDDAAGQPGPSWFGIEVRIQPVR
jgi:hypothetical protein